MKVQAIVNQYRLKAQRLQIQASVLAAYMNGEKVEWYNPINKNWVELVAFECLPPAELPNHTEESFYRLKLVES